MGDNNDIAQMLALLHELQGIEFVRQLRLITERNEFSPLKSDPYIFTVGGRLSSIIGCGSQSRRARLQGVSASKSQRLPNR